MGLALRFIGLDVEIIRGSASFCWQVSNLKKRESSGLWSFYLL